jgi:hypothetical protein
MYVNAIDVNFNLFAVPAIFKGETKYRILTVCKLHYYDEILCCGKALQHPGDEFDLVKGLRISLARALKQGNISKETREVIWRDFRDYIASLGEQQVLFIS